MSINQDEPGTLDIAIQQGKDQELKDLLTLAAKACGYQAEVSEIGPKCSVRSKDGYWARWAPHLDDGDGARMEAKLHLSPDWGNSLVESGRDGFPGWTKTTTLYADHNGDEQAARRWASLRAAAQIGRSMP